MESLLYKKTPILIQMFAVLRRSVGLLGNHVEKGEPDTQRHTPIYCNPAAHVHQGLIMIKWVTLQCASIHCCKKLIVYLVRPEALTHKSQGQKEKQTCV